MKQLVITHHFLFIATLLCVPVECVMENDVSTKHEATNEQKQAQNLFFKEYDVNGDGTLQRGEVQDLVRRLGGERYDEDIEVIEAARQAIIAIETNRQNGIQASELIGHFNRVSARLTVEDVADLISHAVQLPQYAENFRVNAIKGFDLPLLLEDNGEPLKEMGIKMSLHRQVLMRSIKVWLMGIAKPPAQPILNCTYTEKPCEVSIAINTGRTLEEKTQDIIDEIPVHKWRLFQRTSPTSPWKFVAEGSPNNQFYVYSYCEHSDSCDCLGFDQTQFRVESWNSIGKSPAKIIAASTCSRLPTTSVVQYTAFYDSTPKCDGNSARTFSSGVKMYDIEDDMIVVSLDDINETPKVSSLVSQNEDDMCNYDAISGIPAYETKVPKIKEIGNFAESSVSEATLNLFQGADFDGDGDIDYTELKSFIRDLDDSNMSKEDVVESAETAMDAMDLNLDHKILANDIERHWVQLAQLLTPDRVAAWIEHSVLLPQYAKQFEKEEVTGLELPKLLQPKAAPAFWERLAIENVKHRSQITRAIKIRMMAIVSLPQIPQLKKEKSSTCNAIMLRWQQPSSEQHVSMPHRYIVKRRISNNDWLEVYSGPDTSFEDIGLKTGIRYFYKIESWNIAGSSGYSELLSVSIDNTHLPPQSCKTSGSSISALFVMLITAPFRFIFAEIYYFYSTIIPIITGLILVKVWGKLPVQFRLRVHFLYEAYLSPHLKEAMNYLLPKRHAISNTESSPLHQEAAALLSGRQSNPNSPKVEAIRLGDPSFRFRPSNRESSGGQLHPLSLSERVNGNQSEGSDNENVNSASFKSRKRWQLLRQRYKLLNRSAKAFSTGNSSGNESDSVGDKKERKTGDHCDKCGVSFVSVVAKIRKHHCGSCHRVLCKKHMAVTPHAWWSPCAINSKCRCIDCAIDS